MSSSVNKLGAPVLTIGEVAEPWGVAISKKGEIVVSEWLGSRVSVFNPSGETLQSFGTCGSSLGQFQSPHEVAMDGEGNILVADCKNCRIQKFTTDGQFLKAVGTKGSGPLQFNYPTGIAFNSSNNRVYVAEFHGSRVQILNSDLKFSSTFGKRGSRNGQFIEPRSLACDSTGKVYVTDTSGIQVFTASGKFLKMFQRHEEELACPFGIAVSSSDLVYVSYHARHCVSVYTSTGQLVTSFGKCGQGPGEFMKPYGLAVDDCGVVYVCDNSNNRVQCF